MFGEPNNNPPTPDNTAIQQYNQQINQKLQDFQNRLSDLQIEADTKEALLFSVEQDRNSLPELATQLDIIFLPQELPKLKEELKGDESDADTQNNNQDIENRNPRIIDE